MEIELVVVPWSSFNLMSYVISIFDMCIYISKQYHYSYSHIHMWDHVRQLE